MHSAQTTSMDDLLNEQPFCEKITLFTAGVDGYYIYRIPGMIVTPAGSILAYIEARRDKQYGDWGQIDIFMRRSTDGGKTWDNQRKIAHLGDPVVPYDGAPSHGDTHHTARQTVNNSVAFADHVTGQVHVLYCIDYHNCFYMVSDDDGLTFSKPVQITECMEPWKKQVNWKLIATGPGHGIQLRSGRLIVPVWLSPSGEEGHEHLPNTVSTIYSDDHGKTWQAGQIVAPIDWGWNLNETAITQLSDGRVMLNIRSQRLENKRLISFSDDGSSDWSVPVFDDALSDPVCMASLINMDPHQTDAPNRILFANPSGQRRRKPDEPNNAWCHRENLVVRLSLDDAKTWPYARLLQSGHSSYSDLAVHDDQTILCFYEMENEQQIHDVLLARFNLAWLCEK